MPSDSTHDIHLLTHSIEASLAQSVERTALNRVVVGSSPTGSVFSISLSSDFLFYPIFSFLAPTLAHS